MWLLYHYDNTRKYCKNYLYLEQSNFWFVKSLNILVAYLQIIKLIKELYTIFSNKKFSIIIIYASVYQTFCFVMILHLTIKPIPAKVSIADKDASEYLTKV